MIICHPWPLKTFQIENSNKSQVVNFFPLNQTIQLLIKSLWFIYHLQTQTMHTLKPNVTRKTKATINGVESCLFGKLSAQFRHE